MLSFHIYFACSTFFFRHADGLESLPHWPFARLYCFPWLAHVAARSWIGSKIQKQLENENKKNTIWVESQDQNSNGEHLYLEMKERTFKCFSTAPSFFLACYVYPFLFSLFIVCMRTRTGTWMGTWYKRCFRR